MTNELTISYPTGNTLYAVVLDAVGQAWNGSAFEAPIDASWTTYAVAFTEAESTGLYSGDMPAVDAGVYTFVARKQAGGSPAIGDISIGTGVIQWDGTAEIGLNDIPADAWGYSSRTLTQSAAQVAAAVTGSDIVILRGDTFVASLTGLGSLTGYVSLDWTVKRNKANPDDQAIIRIRKNLSGTDDGLLVLNGQDASARSANGSITIDDIDTGDVTITLEAEETRNLGTKSGSLYYDLQEITATTVETHTAGSVRIAGDVTRAIG